ncbi:hypothetical protein PR202_ga16969 [Eleusine coracana subsp. coracana]|uniref:F-box domain-containing protein n=1 Tax=Eleusine coracana subsp. coracana TaxID=191504 RepID=A0AAV5CN11_ELECO|nr:hypothetical protein PR202_ga16969 [Eleusine coracana subsp. coracana]
MVPMAGGAAVALGVGGANSWRGGGGPGYERISGGRRPPCAVGVDGGRGDVLARERRATVGARAPSADSLPGQATGELERRGVARDDAPARAQKTSPLAVLCSSGSRSESSVQLLISPQKPSLLLTHRRSESSPPPAIMDLSEFRLVNCRFVPDFIDQNEKAGTALKYAYKSLPPPPATTAAARAPPDGVKRISRLPDQHLRNIVSRLVAKDAVRTGALASRWRRIWRSAPLVFLDAGLPPQCRKNPIWRPLLQETLGINNAVSAILKTHQGPFRCVQITCCYLDMNKAQIKKWLQPIANKGVQELAFINRPWPLNLPLPASLFSCTSLTRLHIGAWKFPNTAALPEAAGFPHLKELFLTSILMKDQDLAFLLERSPVLEFLTIISSQTDVCLCLVSHSLRCLQLGLSSLGDIAVADAPRLESLLLWMTQRRGTGGNKFSRIKIANAPNLSRLGYCNLGQHQLQIGDTIIESSTKVSSSTIIPSVQVLALEVHFEVRKELMTVPSFLKCFPNVETLHIKSMKVDQPTGKVKFNFWQEACPVQCVQHIKKLVIHEFKGSKNEHAFIKFIGQRAGMLEGVVLVPCRESWYMCSESSLHARMKPFLDVKWVSKKMKHIRTNFRYSPTPWNFRMGIDVSCRDPFDLDNALPTDASSSDE